MVVGFVFEHHQPLLCGATVDGDGHDDGGGVDFFRDLEVVELAGFFHLAHADEGDVHERNRFILATERAAGGEVSLPSVLHGLGVFTECYRVNFR